MPPLIQTTGTVVGTAGVLLCLASGLARVSGSFYLIGFESTSIFLAGMGLMQFACLLKLETISRRPR
jgi:hypothetical protein